MIYKVKLVFFLLIFSFLKIFSQTKVYAIDIENKRCHESSIPTTKAAITCENNALIAWEKEMNTYLGLLRNKRKTNKC